MSDKLNKNFFQRDVLEIAPLLPGKKLIRIINGERKEYIITEVEAYRGMEDLACHASKGRTNRTDIMFQEGGHIYMYLIYGMYWMFNIVTGPENNPQAILIRAVSGTNGPGKLTRELKMDKSFNAKRIFDSEDIWLEESDFKAELFTGPRIGVEYAGEYWSQKPWRFYIEVQSK